MDYETLSTGRGGRLHAKLWVGTDSPKGILILIHGLGDHSGRFAEVAAALCDRWAVFAIDLPGHGHSPGKPGRMPRFAHLLEDIALASRSMTDRYGDLPQVILGHSMGGNLAISYLLRRKEIASDSVQPAGLVLCAPMLMPPRPMPRPWIFAAWLTGYLFPFLRFGPNLNADELTSDPEELRKIQEDPKLHAKISMHLATQLVAQGRWALDQARQIQWPTLIMYGKDDSLIDQAACENLAIRIGDTASLEAFADTKHALFHDQTKAAVIGRLGRWLDSNFVDETA